MFLKKINLKNKRVFLRADLNVPLQNKKIMQDYRLQQILPTIDHIQKNGGKVILATHIGRPPAASQKNFFDENLSTKLLVGWFEEQGYKIDYEIDLLKAAEESRSNFDQILLLENLRFFNGEKETNQEFARLLAQCGDVYINDAFGLMHRNDTSITLLPKEFDEDSRAFGLLVEKEIETLTKLKENPTQPFVVVLGGTKLKTKIAMLESLIEQPLGARPRAILLGGIITKELLTSQEDTYKNFFKKGKELDVNIVLTIDVVTDEAGTVSDIAETPSESIFDIGPQTIELFKKCIKSTCRETAKAKTIFANGTMGMYENEQYTDGSREILGAIAQSDAHKIIGGGDAVAATFQFGLENEMDFLSTGGGATLAFLAGKLSL